ncbi:MAG: transporter, partial [Bacteroidota bacterium]|nr:transporter [Bacteroidota bacterium]
MTGVKLKYTLLFIATVLLLRVSSVHAQELEPRTYTHIPIGLNFLVAGYAYTAGGVVFDPTIPIVNANIRIHGTVLAYARSIKIGGLSGKFDMLLPYAWLSGSAEYQGQTVPREVSGLGDSRLRMTVNFLGAPPLALSEYKGASQDLVAGASLLVYLPMGQYDPEKLVNIGTNRFTIKPELGISRVFGKFSMELATGVAFFTANNDFYGDVTRTQAPIVTLQAHGIYSFKGG